MHDEPNSATRDAMTGAANEPGLVRFTAAVLELMDHKGPPVGFLHVAIDGFGDIGAHLGEAARNALLLGVADRLHEGVRAQDLVGRLGDDFGICMPDLLPAQARGAAERLRLVLSATPLPTSAGALAITCSVGVVMAHGNMVAQALMAAARVATGTAQRSGGDRIVAAG